MPEEIAIFGGRSDKKKTFRYNVSVLMALPKIHSTYTKAKFTPTMLRLSERAVTQPNQQ